MEESKTNCNGTCEVCECNLNNNNNNVILSLPKYLLQSRSNLERSSSKLNTNN